MDHIKRVGRESYACDINNLYLHRSVVVFRNYLVTLIIIGEGKWKQRNVFYQIATQWLYWENFLRLLEISSVYLLSSWPEYLKTYFIFWHPCFTFVKVCPFRRSNDVTPVTFLTLWGEQIIVKCLTVQNVLELTGNYNQYQQKLRVKGREKIMWLFFFFAFL